MTARSRCILLSSVVFCMAVIGCNDQHVSVSSDGNQVAISHGGALWVADIQKESWQKLIVNGGGAESPEWSPDGRRVLVEMVQQPAEGATNADTAQDDDPGYAALYDVDGKQIAKPAGGVHAPFLWMRDGQSFVATTVSKDGETCGLAWFSLDGAKLQSVALPKKLSNITNLVAGHGADIAFVAQREVGDDAVTGVYRTSGAGITRLAEGEGIAGLVYIPEGNGGKLLWTSVRVDDRRVSVKLFQCDPTDDEITARPLLVRSGAIPPDPNAELSVESVTFAPNGSRLALIAKSTLESGNDNATMTEREACYSIETNASGMHAICQTEPNGGDITPAWSADGRRLIVVQMEEQRPHLYVYSYDGTGKRLAPPPDEAPS